MVDKRLPDYRLKQKILYIDNTPEDELARFGDMFLAAGIISDALDFYQKAKNIEGIQKIKQIALTSGDVMLFMRAVKITNEELHPTDWEAVGQIAFDLKKYLFAKHALEKTNNETLLNNLKKAMDKEEQVKQE